MKKNKARIKSTWWYIVCKIVALLIFGFAVQACWPEVNVSPSERDIEYTPDDDEWGSTYYLDYKTEFNCSVELYNNLGCLSIVGAEEYWSEPVKWQKPEETSYVDSIDNSKNRSKYRQYTENSAKYGLFPRYYLLVAILITISAVLFIVSRELNYRTQIKRNPQLKNQIYS